MKETNEASSLEGPWARLTGGHSSGLAEANPTRKGQDHSPSQAQEGVGPGAVGARSRQTPAVSSPGRGR